METDKELSKKARPGELTIRGTMEPDAIIGPPGNHALFVTGRNPDGTYNVVDPTKAHRHVWQSGDGDAEECATCGTHR